MIDSHCHLADKSFKDDLKEVIARAKAAGVSRLVTIGDDLGESAACVDLADAHEEIYCTVGVHPHKAKDWKDGDEATLKGLVASSLKVRAIGEIGLDYHYDFSPREAQRAAFRAQLALAKELALPCVVHCREAVADLRAIIEELAPPSLVIHCCTEKYEDVAWALERGYLLGFTGIATYKTADTICDTIRRTPAAQMLIETDAPYLAPVPHRGKRCEPAFVVEVAKLIAELKGLSLAEVDAITAENTVQFYKLQA